MWKNAQILMVTGVLIRVSFISVLTARIACFTLIVFPTTYKKIKKLYGDNMKYLL